jgi:hypothetical protein
VGNGSTNFLQSSQRNKGNKKPIPFGMGFVFYSDSTRIQASGLPVF